MNVIEGLCGIRTLSEVDRRLLYIGEKEKLRSGRRMRCGSGGLDHAESDVAFFRRVARRHAGAIGGAHEIRCGCGNHLAGFRFAEIETASAHDTKVSMQRTRGIDLRRGGIRAVPIRDPLRRALAHDHAPRVCLARAGRRVAAGKRSLRARAYNVLPLGFGGQPVGPAGSLREPGAECHGLVVADAGRVIGIRGDGLVGGIELLELLDGD